MRIIFLNDTWTIVLCFLLWGFLQVTASQICARLPDRFFSSEFAFYREYPFEREGKIYDRIFQVHRWKHLLPDGGRVFNKKGYKKRRLENFSEENLNRFLVESARGEVSHWLAIFPFWIFGFFTPPIVTWIMLIYALLINLPCIIAQRYNRPRVKCLLKKIQNKNTRLSLKPKAFLS